MDLFAELASSVDLFADLASSAHLSREDDVTITIKCFASLAGFQPADAEEFPISPGETVAEVMTRLGIPEGGVALIFVDNVHRRPETVLKDGDTVGFFPPIGGG